MDYKTEQKDRGPHTRHPSAPSYWRVTKLHRICDALYYFGTFPVGVATCVMFWVLYAIEPTLVMPLWAEKLIPRFVNHVTHTAPIPFVLVDTLLTCHHAPPKKLGSVVSVALVFGYYFIVLMVRLVDGYWLYPLFDHLNGVYFTGVFILSCIGFCALYVLGDFMNTVLWVPHHITFPASRCLCSEIEVMRLIRTSFSEGKTHEQEVDTFSVASSNEILIHLMLPT
ncbi:unnamed protein product [Anisakis simplex]|uniref:Protein TIC 20 n=1 Tax=Anisakis simplex TaxID=6269 RepID=A0A0M3K648_ANISI|nr:unnamed protein product [Anisakis simplex]